MNAKTLIFIVGPQAVGKMTVGQELGRATGFKFMHNHQTIDLLLPFFEHGSPSFMRLLLDFRRNIFEEIAAHETIAGFIFSCVWNFDSILDGADMEMLSEPFSRRGGRILFVELEADLETRLERNRSEHRLHHKPSKRDVEFSSSLLMKTNGRYNSNGDFPYPKRHLKINNEHLSPHEVVAMVCARFELSCNF